MDREVSRFAKAYLSRRAVMSNHLLLSTRVDSELVGRCILRVEREEQGPSKESEGRTGIGGMDGSVGTL